MYREDCIKTTDNVYIKDLRIFRNRELKDIVIVDNAVYSFGFQLANGIPIIPFREDPEDNEFKSLMHCLEIIAKADDVRDVNRELFSLEKVYKFNLDNFIHHYTYEDDSYGEEDDEEDVQEESKQREGRESSTNISNSGKENNKLPKSINKDLDEFSCVLNSMVKKKTFQKSFSG